MDEMGEEEKEEPEEEGGGRRSRRKRDDKEKELSDQMIIKVSCGSVYCIAGFIIAY